MNKADYYICKTIKKILKEGYLDENPRPKYQDGTPAHTLSINHVMRQYDISKGEFPITTLRPIAWKSAIKEILWIYQDQSNDLRILREKYGVKVWDLWESKDIPNTIGARYGEVVRRYGLIDKLLDELVNDPFGRRHIIDLYQYTEMNETDGLHPCAFLTIWNIRKGKDGKKYLDMALIQRSGDLLTASCSGFNEIQYTALMMMVAAHCGYQPGIFTHFVTNEQVYDRHVEQAEEILARQDRVKKVEKMQKAEGKAIEMPKLLLNPEKHNFYDFTIDDFTMEGYTPLKPQLTLDLGI